MPEKRPTKSTSKSRKASNKNNKASASKSAEEFSREILNNCFNAALNEGRLLTPDETMKEMEEFLLCYFSKPNQSDKPLQVVKTRINLIAVWRKAHHYAVDLYYDSLPKSDQGAPPYSDQYYEYLLLLRDQKLSYGQIAIKLQLPMNTPYERTSSTNLVSKQIKTARKRLVSTSGSLDKQQGQSNLPTKDTSSD